MLSRWPYREHQIEAEYSSYDDAILITIAGPEPKHMAYGAGTGVDEIQELIDDLIDSMTSPWPDNDHEDEIINSLDDHNLDNSELDEIKETMKAIVDDYDEHNRSYMEYRGYQCHVLFDPGRELITGLILGLAHTPEVSARSLQRLYHRFCTLIDDYLVEAQKDLPTL